VAPWGWEKGRGKIRQVKEVYHYPRQAVKRWKDVDILIKIAQKKKEGVLGKLEDLGDLLTLELLLRPRPDWRRRADVIGETEKDRKTITHVAKSCSRVEG